MSERRGRSKRKRSAEALGARVLAAPLIRRLEMIFTGDYKAAFVREVCERLKGDELVLDVGAGSGFFSLLVAERLESGKVICLDASSAMLDHLDRRAKLKGLGARVRTLVSDATSAGIDDGSVDLVISCFVLHELKEPEAAVAEMRRVLKPGGRVAIIDFVKGTLVGKRIAAAHGGASHGPLGTDELEALLAGVGFRDVQVERTRGFMLGTAKG